MVSPDSRGESYAQDGRAATDIKQAEVTAGKYRNRGLTKDVRKTTDTVLDNRTRDQIHKVIRSGLISRALGCVSGGKEAHVYYAPLEDEEGEIIAERVLKVYQTSALKFKNRSDYTKGDSRYDTFGYNGTNPRKMVAQWASKESRNLYRLSFSGVRSPFPLVLRRNVLAMTYLGSNGVTSPRLKDVTHASSITWARLYVEAIALLRFINMAPVRLTHGDYSEFNLLLHNGHVYVIDVSQSISTKEPRTDFVKRDCHNVTIFFRKILGKVPDRDGSKIESFSTTEKLNVSNKSWSAKDVSINDSETLHSVRDAFGGDGSIPILSVSDLFHFVYSKKLPDFEPIANLKWPRYDDEFLRSTLNGIRGGGERNPGDERASTDLRPIIEREGEDKLLNAIMAGRKVFDTLCEETLGFLWYKENERVDKVLKANGKLRRRTEEEVTEECSFLQMEVARTLHEVNIDRVTREGATYLLDKYSYLLNSDTECQSQSDSDSESENGEEEEEDETNAMGIDEICEFISELISWLPEAETKEVERHEFRDWQEYILTKRKYLRRLVLRALELSGGGVPMSMSEQPKEWKRIVKISQRLTKQDKIPKHLKSRMTRKNKKKR